MPKLFWLKRVLAVLPTRNYTLFKYFGLNILFKKKRKLLISQNFKAVGIFKEN